MLNRECLSREHAELSALAEALSALLTGATPDLAGLSAVRWRFHRTLLMHLAKEDKLLYPQLARSPLPRTAHIAAQFASDVCGLAQDYAAYMQRWSIERIEAEWTTFGRETCVILAALTVRIAREEAELYPCIVEPAAIPARPLRASRL